MSKLTRLIRQRDHALISMDAALIRSYMREAGAPIPQDEEVFWGSVHKARTALTSLPLEERSKSKKWLQERGWQSLDDGDVP